MPDPTRTHPGPRTCGPGRVGGVWPTLVAVAALALATTASEPQAAQQGPAGPRPSPATSHPVPSPVPGSPPVPPG